MNKSNNRIKYAATESQYLGIKIGRLELDNFETDAFLRSLFAEEYDVLKLSIGRGKQEMMQQLEQLNLPYYITDTIFLYRLRLHTKENNKSLLHYNVEIEQANSSHYDLLKNIAQTTFAQNYHAFFHNPDLKKVIKKQNNLALFGKWAADFCLPNKEGKKVYLLKHHGNYCAFTALQEVRETKILHGVVSGVLPAYRKMGYMTDLIRWVSQQEEHKNINWIYTKTQAQNLAATQSYTREGFRFYGISITLNINSLLSFSCQKTAFFEGKINEKNLPAFFQNKVLTFLSTKNKYQSFYIKKMLQKNIATLTNSFFVCKILTTYETESDVLKVFKFYVSQKIVTVIYVYLKKM
ncbi:MAG: GNAT family N-acetyltransferase [Chitinophagales bacterium]